MGWTLTSARAIRALHQIIERRCRPEGDRLRQVAGISQWRPAGMVCTSWYPDRLHLAREEPRQNGYVAQFNLTGRNG